MKANRKFEKDTEIEDNIIKNVRNLFIPKKKKIEDNIIKDVRNIFRLKKENKVIKNRTIRDIRNLFDFEKEENYYKLEPVGNFYSNNYIEYKRNGHRNKTLSIKEYLNEIRPYLKDVINNLKKIWYIENSMLTLAINFMSFKDTDKERLKHSKSDNIKIMINDKADEVIEELFESLLFDIKSA